jgi:acetyltransferase-like isoleucine patch superfamily enzyme
MVIRNRILKRMCNMIVLYKYRKTWNKMLGVQYIDGGGDMVGTRVVGDYSNIVLHKNSEINDGCYLLAKAKIEIGENSTLAYRVTVLTGADPNGPYNALSTLYPAKKAPVFIGKDVWVGANSTILPGVTIGDFVVVAAGSVVTKDVPSGVLVAGVPAEVKKVLKKEDC